MRAELAAGADLRDDRNRRRVPLGPSSIRKAISCLAAIVDDAIEDGYIDRNPARGKRMRIKVPKPPRTFLELDELRALVDAGPAKPSRQATGRVGRDRPPRRRDSARSRRSPGTRRSSSRLMTRRPLEQLSYTTSTDVTTRPAKRRFR